MTSNISDETTLQMLPTIQNLIANNNITQHDLYLYVTNKDYSIPEYCPELIENDNKIKTIFNQYIIEFENQIIEEYDEANWHGYIIYKISDKISGDVVYLKSTYYHNSYNKIHDSFNSEFEFVEKTEETVIKYEENIKQKIEYKFIRDFEEYLKDKNVVCVISDEQMISEWENRGYDILEWPSLEVTDENRRKEIKDYIMYVFGLRAGKKIYACILFPRNKKLNKF